MGVLEFHLHPVLEFNLTKERKKMDENGKKIKEISVSEFH